MLVFKMKKNGVPYQMELHLYSGKETTPIEIREYANQLWVTYLSDPTVTELMGVYPDGTVRIPTENKPYTWGVWGKFSDSPKAKLYPFECDKQIKEGCRFLAMPNGIPTVATVVKCVWVRREKVIQAASGHPLFKIRDVVMAV